MVYYRWPRRKRIFIFLMTGERKIGISTTNNLNQGGKSHEQFNKLDHRSYRFCGVAYGMYWVVTKFGLPQPVLWICGAVLLIILLLFVAQMLGVGGGNFQWR